MANLLPTGAPFFVRCQSKTCAWLYTSFHRNKSPVLSLVSSNLVWFGLIWFCLVWFSLVLFGFMTYQYCRLFYAKSMLCIKIVLFQAIQFSIHDIT